MTEVRGPKGVRISDLIVADGARWEVVGLDAARREAIGRLQGGSRVLHRFRARQIREVVRGPRELGRGAGMRILAALDDRRRSVDEIAAATGLQPNSMHRYLPVLERLGEVERCPGNPTTWRRA